MRNVLDLRGQFGINLVTVKRGGEDAPVVLGVPSPNWVLEKDDALVVFGKERDIQKFSGPVASG